MSKVAVVMLGNTVARINSVIRIASKVSSDVRSPKASKHSTHCHQRKCNTVTVRVYIISTNTDLIKFSKYLQFEQVAVMLTVPFTRLGNRRPLTSEARIRSQASPCGIFPEISKTMTSFSPSTLVFPQQYLSTNDP